MIQTMTLHQIYLPSISQEYCLLDLTTIILFQLITHIQLNYKQNLISNQMIQLGASIVSSTISTVLLYPAQRIKIQMQLSTVRSKSQQVGNRQTGELDGEEAIYLKQQRSAQGYSELLISQRPSKKTISKSVQLIPQQIEKSKNKMSIQQIAAYIYRKHGWTGFYTGLQSLVIGNGLSYGVYFVIYQKCKKHLGFQPGSVLDTIKCSSIAGTVASLATNPFWVLQTKQTQQKGSILKKGRQLIEREGILALWKGLSSSLILVANPIIQFVIYEQLKKLTAIQKDSNMYDLVIFIIGAISKMISTLCTYPMTVIRTKQHVSTDRKQWTKIVKQIIRTDGVEGLFKGIQPKLVQTVLNSALLLMLFEKIRTMLLKYYNSKN